MIRVWRQAIDSNDRAPYQDYRDAVDYYVADDGCLRVLKAKLTGHNTAGDGVATWPDGTWESVEIKDTP